MSSAPTYFRIKKTTMKHRNGQDNGGLSSLRSDGENRGSERGGGWESFLQSSLDAAMGRTGWWLLRIIICLVGMWAVCISCSIFRVLRQNRITIWNGRSLGYSEFNATWWDSPAKSCQIRFFLNSYEISIKFWVFWILIYSDFANEMFLGHIITFLKL